MTVCHDDCLKVATFLRHSKVEVRLFPLASFRQKIWLVIILTLKSTHQQNSSRQLFVILTTNSPQHFSVSMERKTT